MKRARQIKTYPVDPLKTIQQEDITQSLSSKFQENWNSPDPINLKNTLLLTKEGAGKENWLDSSHTKEICYRAKTILQKTHSVVEVHKCKPQVRTKCPRCLREPESQNHIWVCTETLRARQDLIRDTIKIMNDRQDILQMYRPLRDSKKQPPDSYFLYFMGIRPNDTISFKKFLESKRD
jgi:hypothetical protein